MPHQVWESINLVNLQHYIQPTRNRADLILHKATNHEIDEIYLNARENGLLTVPF